MFMLSHNLQSYEFAAEPQLVRNQSASREEVLSVASILGIPAARLQQKSSANVRTAILL